MNTHAADRVDEIIENKLDSSSKDHLQESRSRTKRVAYDLESQSLIHPLINQTEVSSISTIDRIGSFQSVPTEEVKGGSENEKKGTTCCPCSI